MRKLIRVVVGIIVVLGMGWTVLADYRPWVHAEKDNYGHGPGELGQAGVVNKLFQEAAVAVRIGYPESWTVAEVWWKNKNNPGPEVAEFRPKTSDVKVSLWVYYKTGSLVDITDAWVKEKEKLGWVAWGARQYISSDRTDVTVLTWQIKQPDGKVRMQQEGLAKRGDRVAVVEAECSLSDWRTFKGTFWEMFKSLILI